MISEKYIQACPEQVELENAVCPVCQTDEFMEHQFDASDRINNLDGLFGVDFCSNCGLYITNPRPNEETIGYYYPDSYGPYLSTEIKKYSGFSRLLQSAKSLLNTKETYVPKLKSGVVLDIGCASGSFLFKMKEIGWEAEGLEFSQSAVDKAVEGGLNVRQGSMSNFKTENGKYDLITAWMVLEHLYDPIDALSKVNDWLKHGGVFAFSVPNAVSVDFQKLKGCAYGIQVPTHLYHFTPKMISSLLERQGFSSIEIHHQRTLGSLIPSLGFALLSRGRFTYFARKLIGYSKASPAFKMLLYPVACLFALFGQTGRMTVIARKK